MEERLFRFRFDPRFRRLLAILGVTPDTAWIRVGESLRVRFGPWRVQTPLSNVEGVQLTGPYSPWKAIGPHLSLADRGMTLGTNTERGVCMTFRRPIPGIDPLGVLKHPGVTVTAEDPEGLAAALRSATT